MTRRNRIALTQAQMRFTIHALPSDLDQLAHQLKRDYDNGSAVSRLLGTIRHSYTNYDELWRHGMTHEPAHGRFKRWCNIQIKLVLVAWHYERVAQGKRGLPVEWVDKRKAGSR